MPISID